MTNKIEGTINILAAFFVLFSAMIEPKISAGLAIFFFACLSIYKFTRK